MQPLNNDVIQNPSALPPATLGFCPAQAQPLGPWELSSETTSPALRANSCPSSFSFLPPPPPIFLFLPPSFPPALFLPLIIYAWKSYLCSMLFSVIQHMKQNIFLQNSFSLSKRHIAPRLSSTRLPGEEVCSPGPGTEPSLTKCCGQRWW